MALTSSQQAAVDHQGNLVMFAGPGSGKTSTSVKKVVKTLMDPNETQLMTTFTRESAAEMRVRFNKAFEDLGMPPVSEDRLRICTFDSLTLWHLKNFRRGDVKLLNPGAQMPRLFQLCKELDIGDYNDHSQWFDAYQATIDREKLMATIESESPKSLHLIEAYYEWMKSAGIMDLATVKRTVAIQMQQGNMPLLPFGNMLVDESQDCDELQILIAIVMGQNGTKTTLVGDDDQTIYDWRSAAGYKGMIEFRDATGADVVRLAENFRSHEEIVSAATNLIRFNNPNRVEKNQVAIKGPGGSVTVASFSTLENQAEWIAGQIYKTIPEPRDVAILSRTNINLDAAESACNMYGIQVHRPGSSLFDRDDLSAFTAMMTFMLSGGPDMLSQAMGFLGFTRHTINTMLQGLGSTQLSFRRGKTVVVECATPEEQRVIDDMSRCMGKWRQDNKEGAYTIIVGEAVHMFPAWYSQLGAVSKKSGVEHKGVKRLKEGLVFVERVLLKIDGTLKERIRYLRKSKKEEALPGVVRLLTMHSSKGLEWDHVFILGADEKDDDNSITLGPPERRVFFVGMTRARTNLTVTYSGKFPLFLQEAYIPFDAVLQEPMPAVYSHKVPSSDHDSDDEDDD